MPCPPRFLSAALPCSGDPCGRWCWWHSPRPRVFCSGRSMRSPSFTSRIRHDPSVPNHRRCSVLASFASRHGCPTHAGVRLRPCSGSSPHLSAETGSSSYGRVVHLLLLSTPCRLSAVEVGSRVGVRPDGDFHPAWIRALGGARSASRRARPSVSEAQQLSSRDQPPRTERC